MRVFHCSQEHKTDEMHTALMEASMDGHVEVAKLLLDSGAQVRFLNAITWKNENDREISVSVLYEFWRK